MEDDERVDSDGLTVWVHDLDDGSCIGRFGRMGIDIHRRLEDQAAHGQCLLCTHGRTDASDWRRFVAAMKDIYGVTVSERHRPTHIQQEDIHMKIQVHVVTGVHHEVPGRRMSAHLTSTAADVAALALVALIADDVDDAPPAPTDPSQWPAYLADVQRLVVEADGREIAPDADADDLAAAAGCHVEIATLETDAPRIAIGVRGGLVEEAIGDVPLDLRVIDYDVEGQDLEDLISVPQTGDITSEATMRGETVKIDAPWIDRAIAAYDEHERQVADEG